MNDIIQHLFKNISYIQATEQTLQKKIDFKNNSITFFIILFLFSAFVSGVPLIIIKNGYFPLFIAFCKNVFFYSTLLFGVSLIGIGIDDFFKFNKKHNARMREKMGQAHNMRELEEFLKQPIHQKAIIAYLDSAGVSNQELLNYFKIKLVDQHYTDAAQWIVDHFYYLTKEYTKREKLAFLHQSLEQSSHYLSHHSINTTNQVETKEPWIINDSSHTFDVHFKKENNLTENTNFIGNTQNNSIKEKNIDKERIVNAL